MIAFGVVTIRVRLLYMTLNLAQPCILSNCPELHLPSSPFASVRTLVVLCYLPTASTNHTLVNSSDKILRVYSLDQLIYEIQDKVNKLSWKKSIITPDGENIICGSAQNNDHKIYVWTEAGLAKQLDSTETLLDLAVSRIQISQLTL